MIGSEEWNFSPSPPCNFSLPTQDMSSWSLTYCEVIHIFDNLMEIMDRTKILDSFGKRVPVIFEMSKGQVKAMVFPVVMYGCESWTVKKAEC